MCTIETSQDKALIYSLDLKNETSVHSSRHQTQQVKWDGVRIPNRIKIAADPQNPLKKYY